MLGQVDICVHLGLLEINHEMLVADIVDEVILCKDIMNAYGFVVDLGENVLKVGQEKIKLCMAKMTGSTNHSIKRVALIEKSQQVWSRGTLPIASGNGGRTSRGNSNKYNDKRSDWKANYGCQDKILACS